MTQSNEINFPPLLGLLKAKSKEQVLELCETSLAKRKDPAECKDELLAALGDLIATVIYNGLTDVQKISELFPDNFHPNLRELLSKIIADNSQKWTTEAISSQVSMPRLAAFNWSVDTKNSEMSGTRSCLLHLQVENSQSSENVTVELTKESLDKLLDGMSKIKDQISSLIK